MKIAFLTTIFPMPTDYLVDFLNSRISDCLTIRFSVEVFEVY